MSPQGTSQKHLLWPSNRATATPPPLVLCRVTLQSCSPWAPNRCRKGRGSATRLGASVSLASPPGCAQPRATAWTWETLSDAEVLGVTGPVGCVYHTRCRRWALWGVWGVLRSPEVLGKIIISLISCSLNFLHFKKILLVCNTIKLQDNY